MYGAVTRSRAKQLLREKHSRTNQSFNQPSSPTTSLDTTVSKSPLFIAVPPSPPIFDLGTSTMSTVTTATTATTSSSTTSGASSTITTSTTALNPMPDLSIAPTVFSGGPGEDVNDWCRYVQRYLAYKAMPKHNASQMIALLLRGKALTWFNETYQDNPPEEPNDILVAIQKHFAIKPTAKWKHLQLLWNTKQGDSSVDDYIAHMVKMATKVGITGDELVHPVIQGMKPEIRSFVLQKEPKTLAEVNNAAQLAESTVEPSNSTLASQLQQSIDLLHKLSVKQAASIDTPEAQPDQPEPHLRHRSQSSRRRDDYSRNYRQGYMRSNPMSPIRDRPNWFQRRRGALGFVDDQRREERRQMASRRSPSPRSPRDHSNFRGRGHGRGTTPYRRPGMQNRNFVHREVNDSFFSR